MFNPSDNASVATYSEPYSQPTITERTLAVADDLGTKGTKFPMDNPDAQFSWYLDNNIPRYKHCFSYGSCTAEDWAFAIYNDRTNPAGKDLKKRADILKAQYESQFPKKCSGGICDLTYSVIKTYNDGDRLVKLEGNAINCANVVTGEQSQSQVDGERVRAKNTFCVSDLGVIYIDPTIEVSNHFGEMRDLIDGSNYTILNDHKLCIWTYYDGNGAIPYMFISGRLGPASGYSVGAYCTDFDNRVHIYTTAD
jgi:hypothetical protein